MQLPIQVLGLGALRRLTQPSHCSAEEMPRILGLFAVPVSYLNWLRLPIVSYGSPLFVTPPYLLVFFSEIIPKKAHYHAASVQSLKLLGFSLGLSYHPFEYLGHCDSSVYHDSKTACKMDFGFLPVPFGPHPGLLLILLPSFYSQSPLRKEPW